MFYRPDALPVMHQQYLTAEEQNNSHSNSYRTAVIVVLLFSSALRLFVGSRKVSVQ